ncbi:hypothetical protein XENOCAPTIV_014212 [Xenoophorus captivus]|uniref:Uncharacterized protein n=1 Tax=Xenoophorus captivus TaxID=1517983 RepID=A0ABV0RA08_9TELE
MVAQFVVLLPSIKKVLSSTPGRGSFCMEFACSPQARVGSLQVLQVPSIHPSIYPAIVFCLSGVGSQGQQPKKRDPDFPLPSHLGHLIRDNPKAFLGQPRNNVPPACPRSSCGLLPGGTCPKHLTREVSRRHLLKTPPLEGCSACSFIHRKLKEFTRH